MSKPLREDREQYRAFLIHKLRQVADLSRGFARQLPYPEQKIWEKKFMDSLAEASKSLSHAYHEEFGRYPIDDGVVL